MRGKVLGLVQLAKYVTQTQGPRPTAEIPDASCLRSGCHETRLLSGRVDYNGIAFDHAKHLPQDEGQLTRGMHLRCTSCHSQIVQGQHMTVTESTCYLCHFKDIPFNEGLGACTRCHQIPDTEYDLGGGVKFHHDLAYEKGVECASCHADLIRGNGEVPRERCTVCHNREDDFARLKDKEFLHKTHVTDHKVDCMSCHLTLNHSLDANKIATAASQCAACHPNQHQQQVAMLEGSGAQTDCTAPQQHDGRADRLLHVPSGEGDLSDRNRADEGLAGHVCRVPCARRNRRAQGLPRPVEGVAHQSGNRCRTHSNRARGSHARNR